MSDTQIRVLIVEDHLMFAQTLRWALDQEDDIAVTGVAGTVAEALESVAATVPDVILMDYRLPDGDGVDAARRIKAAAPSVKVVMLTASGDEGVLRTAISAGCSGYVTKDQKIEELFLAVRAANSGEALVSPELLSRLVGRLDGDRTRPGFDLTPRETEILRLLGAGMSNQAIAERLGIRLATVRNHVQNLISKMQAHSKLEAVATAARLGVISYERG